MKKEMLETVLFENGVEYREWGVYKGTPTFDDLVQETERGLARVTTFRGIVHRRIFESAVRVYYRLEQGQNLQLQMHVCKKEGAHSLWPFVTLKKKLSQIDSVTETAKELVNTCLGIQCESMPRRSNIPFNSPPCPCEEYPGLFKIRTTTFFTVVLPTKHYVPEGYVGMLDGKPIRLEWHPAVHLGEDI